jgi:hypothetical protein
MNKVKQLLEYRNALADAYRLLESWSWVEAGSEDEEIFQCVRKTYRAISERMGVLVNRLTEDEFAIYRDLGGHGNFPVLPTEYEEKELGW